MLLDEQIESELEIEHKFERLVLIDLARIGTLAIGGSMAQMDENPDCPLTFDSTSYDKFEFAQLIDGDFDL